MARCRRMSGQGRALTHTESLRVTTDDGVELATTLTMSSKHSPGLILVHGFGGAKEDFADHVPALAREHRVAAFDHRGHGESGSPADAHAYSLDRLAHDTLAVADALGMSTFRLLGHSMGGMVAIRLVLDYSQRVDALVLMDTSAGPPPTLDPDLVRVGAEIAARDGMSTLRILLDELDPLGSDAYQRVLRERPGFEEYTQRKWATLSAVMWSELAVEIATQPDVLPALAAVICPALVLVGEQDQAFIEPSFALADTIPDARLVVVPDAGHSPQFENPVVWFAAVDGFLGELPDVRRLRPSPGSAPARR
jgi:pimeloyl-ACP methyl ester carboxylesterase